MNERLRATSLVALSTLILSWPLIWNGFPFVYWDTATYLTRWSVGSPILVQPIYYSYWLMLFHPIPFGLTICALAQAAVTSILLYLLIRESSTERSVTIFMASVALTAISPTVFYITSLMPDVSTLWLTLCCPMSILSKGRRLRYVAAIVILISLVFHNSHVFILIGLLPAFALSIPRSQLRMTSALIVLILVGYAGLYALNNLLARLPAFSSASTFMLAARLNQSGSLHLAFNDLAAQNPDYAEWAERTEELIREPEAFLWDSRSPLNLNYQEWSTDPTQHQEAKAFLSPIVQRGMSQYLPSFLHSAKHNITSMMAGEYLLLGFIYHDGDSMLPRSLRLKWGDEYQRYEQSKQGKGILVSDRFPLYVSTWRRCFYPISLLSAGLVLSLYLAIIRLRLRQTKLPAGGIVALFLLTAFWLNIVACATFSSIATRYVERVFALSLIACTLVIVLLTSSRRRNVALSLPAKATEKSTGTP